MKGQPTQEDAAFVTVGRLRHSFDRCHGPCGYPDRHTLNRNSTSLLVMIRLGTLVDAPAVLDASFVPDFCVLVEDGDPAALAYQAVIGQATTDSHLSDGAIAATAALHGATLLTQEDRLPKRAREVGLPAITLDELLATLPDPPRRP